MRKRNRNFSYNRFYFLTSKKFARKGNRNEVMLRLTHVRVFIPLYWKMKAFDNHKLKRIGKTHTDTHMHEFSGRQWKFQ